MQNCYAIMPQFDLSLLLFPRRILYAFAARRLLHLKRIYTLCTQQTILVSVSSLPDAFYNCQYLTLRASGTIILSRQCNWIMYLRARSQLQLDGFKPISSNSLRRPNRFVINFLSDKHPCADDTTRDGKSDLVLQHIARQVVRVSRRTLTMISHVNHPISNHCLRTAALILTYIFAACIRYSAHYLQLLVRLLLEALRSRDKLSMYIINSIVNKIIIICMINIIIICMIKSKINRN